MHEVPVQPPLVLAVCEDSARRDTVDEDKLQIAKRYLVPKQVEENGLVLTEDIAFTEDALMEVVHGYTHEAGVRKLEQPMTCGASIL